MPLGRRAAVAGVLTLMLWAGGGALRFYGLAHQADVASAGPTTPVVALVQGNVPEQEKISRSDMQRVFGRYLGLTQRGVAQALEESDRTQGAGHPVVYVWPETAFPGVLEEDRSLRQAQAQLSSTLKPGGERATPMSVVG